MQHKNRSALERAHQHLLAVLDQRVDDATIVNAVIDTWMRRRGTVVALRVQELVMQYSTKKIDDALLAKAMQAWVHSQDVSQCGSRVQQWFDQISKPCAVHHRLALQGWAICRQRFAAVQATRHWKSLVQGFRNGDKECEPTVHDVSELLRCWSRTRHASAPKRANRILQDMDELLYEKRTNVVPNLDCYRAVLICCAQNSETKDQDTIVWHILQTMRERFLVPDTTCFKAALNGLVAQKDAVDRVVQVWSQVQLAAHQGKKGHVSATLSMACRVLEALVHSHYPDRYDIALEVVTTMEQEWLDQPHAILYAKAMAVIHSLEDHHKINKAQELLDAFISKQDSMQGKHEHKSAVMDEFLRVCADSGAMTEDRGVKNLRLAMRTTNELRKQGIKPTSSTFENLLRACETLLVTGKTRHTLAQQIFELCTQEGLVDSSILEALQKVTRQKQYDALVYAHATRDQESSERALPESWTTKSMPNFDPNRNKKRVLSTEGDIITVKTGPTSSQGVKQLQGGRLQRAAIEDSLEAF